MRDPILHALLVSVVSNVILAGLCGDVKQPTPTGAVFGEGTGGDVKPQPGSDPGDGRGVYCPPDLSTFLLPIGFSGRRH